MLWKNRRQSGNLIDRRGVGGPLGLGGVVIGAVIYFLMGGNPLEYLSQNPLPQRQEASSVTDDQKQFVSVVLADTEDVWNSIFKLNRLTYKEPRLVLFNHRVQSACGFASSAVGPFYCPGDQQVYLDLSFFRQLSDSLGAQGDFAVAYVIAHEVGHHVQNLLGIDESVRLRQSQGNQRDKNRLSVLMELQADCLAGVWAKETQERTQALEAGDIEEALTAAAAVGDDRLQEASRGEVVPDSFTHGTSAQRADAFRLGMKDGEVEACLRTYR